MAEKSKGLAALKNRHKKATGTRDVKLGKTGITVTVPKFVSHGTWQRSLALARNDVRKAQILLICDQCRFDGEKITAADFDAYVTVSEGMELLGEIGETGDEEEGTEAGKPEAPAVH